MRKNNQSFITVWKSFRYVFGNGKGVCRSEETFQKDMSNTSRYKKLTYATVAIVTEHEPLIAITFVHFIVNVVAILSTGVPIFAPTWKFKKVIYYVSSNLKVLSIILITQKRGFCNYSTRLHRIENSYYFKPL